MECRRLSSQGKRYRSELEEAGQLVAVKREKLEQEQEKLEMERECGLCKADDVQKGALVPCGTLSLTIPFLTYSLQRGGVLCVLKETKNLPPKVMWCVRIAANSRLSVVLVRFAEELASRA
jgi:hypothetical protein